jgi:hypothetical protein
LDGVLSLAQTLAPRDCLDAVRQDGVLIYASRFRLLVPLGHHLNQLSAADNECRVLADFVEKLCG